ncbi:hypothetical protein NEOLI_003692 [Neolecta irregularis DAH-3]|uniref:Spindle pole body component n=1 Tax=Neolecta irregularis (strain DAH-3) TaxID=1198029 RepID=A0A1U7LIM8_NEOID|nr:hypothetical protein NEOLI_003692 [Neolecta irregularis DAH-3]|eukprot:OLL22478.1 hypothetical protein NEOLI_003692 [Neolecta irregularis DAH-3]
MSVSHNDRSKFSFQDLYPQSSYLNVNSTSLFGELDCSLAILESTPSTLLDLGSQGGVIPSVGSNARTIFDLEHVSSDGSEIDLSPREGNIAATTTGKSSEFIDSGSVQMEDPWLNFREELIGEPIFTWENTFQLIDLPYYQEIRVSSDVSISVLCSSLISAASGRNSLLFKWDVTENQFVKNVAHLQIKDVSECTMREIVQIALDCGREFRCLRSLIDEVLDDVDYYGPTLTALSTHLIILLDSYNQGLAKLCSNHSLIQITQEIVDASRILSFFQEIFDEKPRGTKLLDILYNATVQYDRTGNPIGPILFAMLRSCSKVYLALIGKWVGLQKMDSFGGIENLQDWDNIDPSREFFVQKVGNEGDSYDALDSRYQIIEPKIPQFLTDEIIQLIFETGKNIRLLRRCVPDSSVCWALKLNTRVRGINLEFQRTWAEYEELLIEVERYELDVLEEISILEAQPMFAAKKANPLDIWGLSKDGIASALVSLRMAMNHDIPTVKSSSAKSLFEDIASIESSNERRPPLPTFHRRGFLAVLRCQARLVNTMLSSLMFDDLKLNDHFSMLRDTFLFGDGQFAVRFKESVFDELKIVNRKDWPPSGTEVSCAFGGLGIEKGISFAVREEYKPTSINDIEALSFLKMSYTPPFLVDGIISTSIIKKYDQIFLFLIKLIRIDHCCRLRLRLLGKSAYAALTFAQAIMNYTFEHLTITWNSFIKQINHESSIRQLREMHDHALDRMLYGSMLSAGQEPFMDMLNNIFSEILHENHNLGNSIREFVSTISKLNEKGGGRLGRGAKEDFSSVQYAMDVSDASVAGGFLGDLLVKLNINEFW